MIVIIKNIIFCNGFIVGTTNDYNHVVKNGVVIDVTTPVKKVYIV